MFCVKHLNLEQYVDNFGNSWITNTFILLDVNSYLYKLFSGRMKIPTYENRQKKFH